MRRGGFAGVDLVLALAFGLAAGLAVATVVDRLDARDERGRYTRVHSAQTQIVHTEPRIVTQADVPYLLHELDYTAHGGLVRVEWYDGAWAPLAPESGCYVTLVVDDRPVASALLGGRTGTNETRPGSLVWTGQLAAGEHRLEVRVDRADRGFAIPDGRPESPVADGVVVTEWVP